MDELVTPEGRRIAYHLTKGEGVPIAFLGGFRSDMEGSKATHLELWARTTGRTFLRFDYSGHGQSGGAFEEGAIGDWMDDARAALGLLGAPAVLVGSSMGGWISLLLARDHPDLVAGLVTIAAAPDFTEDGFWAGFSEDDRRRLMENGAVEVPSDFEAPYTVTRRLIEEGRDRFVLRSALDLPVVVRMVQGTADTAVSTETALRLLDHATCDDIRLTLVKGADHSFSSPECLTLVERSIEEVLARA